MNIQVPGFQDVEVKMAGSDGYASCVAKLGGSLYFVYFSLARREDGTVRERLFSRRLETFCGKPVRAKVRHQLADLADAASEVIVAAVA